MLTRAGLLGLAAMAAIACAVWFLMPQSVEVVHPVRGDAVQAVYATGTVEPSVMTPIAPRVAARLVELAVDEGAAVRQGQMLGRLESADLASTIAQFAAQEVYAHGQYARYLELLREGAIARQAVDKAKADWLAARAASEQARVQAGYMTLAAPCVGHVIRRDGELGQFIPANQAIFWLSCNAPPRISTEVDEEDIARVRVGQQALIRADAFPDRIFRGTVSEITPKGDPVARSYRVRIALAADTPLMIGMTTEANIIIYRRSNALLVPTAALAGKFLWLADGGRLHKLPVRIGARGEATTEILSDLPDAAQLVRLPDATLTEGDRVRAVPGSWTP